MPLIRRRKRQPITFRDAYAAAKEIGVDELRSMDRSEAAAAVAAVALKAKAVDPEDPSIDWDNLISFIERLLPLILTLIELFS